MVASGLPIGLATEASFGPLEGNPFVNACLELVVLVDDERGFVVAEHEVDYSVPAVSMTVRDNDISSIPLTTAGFPEHGLIVRPVEGYSPLVKGIHDIDDLRSAIAACTEASASATVVVENDLRAHHSPTRMQAIARAAERLARRVATLCPRCDAPGWGIVERQPGAPCRECGEATSVVRSEMMGCVACDVTAIRDLPDAAGVDPRHCPSCNP
jgi:hypothetical protein